MFSLRGVELFEDDGRESPEGATAGSEKQFAPPEVTEMFMVNGNTQDFFKPLGHSWVTAILKWMCSPSPTLKCIENSHLWYSKYPGFSLKTTNFEQKNGENDFQLKFIQ